VELQACHTTPACIISWVFSSCSVIC
jgi:hypothetical protein